MKKPSKEARTQSVEEKLATSGEHVVEKNKYEEVSHFIYYILTITVLMAGTIAVSFTQINGFSFFLIVVYALVLIPAIVCAVIAIHKKKDTLAIWVMYLFVALVTVWIIYAVGFLVVKCQIGISFNINQLSENLTSIAK